MDITININADVISIIGAVVAFLSMIISWRQAHIAKKSLKMEAAIFNDRKPNFTFDSIVDSYCINDKNEDDVHLRFLILLTNRSDRPMTINQIRLRVRGESLELIVRPTLADSSLNGGDNIEGNHSMRNWVQFDLPRQQYLNLGILDYTIEVQDAHGNLHKNSAIFLREEVRNYEDHVET